MYSIKTIENGFRIMLAVLLLTASVLWPVERIQAETFNLPGKGDADTKALTTLAGLSSLDEVTELQENDLQELRGCYDSYYFALDIGINMTGSTPSVNVQFSAQVPQGTAAPSFSGNAVSFNNGNVSFQAGVGNNSLGAGFYQVIGVAGNQNIVIANTNITINVQNLSSLVMPNVLNNPLSKSIFGRSM
jgi:hypothetical protein